MTNNQQPDVGSAHLESYHNWIWLSNTLVSCVPDRATHFVNIMRGCYPDPLRSEAFFSPPYLLHMAVAQAAPNDGQAELAHNEQTHRFFQTIFTELEEDLNGILYVQDKEQRTPLHVALETGNMTLVNFFINRGSPIDLAGTNGTMATTRALKSRNPEFLELLIKRGAGFHFMFRAHETSGYETCLRDTRRGAQWMFDTASEMYRSLQTAISAKEKELKFEFRREGPIMCYCSQGSDIGSIDFRWFVGHKNRLIMSLYRVVWNHQQNRFVVLAEKVRLRRIPLMEKMGSSIRHQIPYAGRDYHYEVSNSTVNSLLEGRTWSDLWTLHIDLREIPVDYFVVCRFVKV